VTRTAWTTTRNMLGRSILCLAAGAHASASRGVDDTAATALVPSMETPLSLWLRHHNVRLDNLATRKPVSKAARDSARLASPPMLDAMRANATRTRSCHVSDVAAATMLGAARVHGDSPHAARQSEVIICRPARLAYIHVYKAAGTTIFASMHDLCQSEFGQPAETLCPRSYGDYCEDLSVHDEWHLVSNYTWFTFVRDSVDRFESSVFELAKRFEDPAEQKGQCVVRGPKDDSAIRPANRRGDQLALDILHECLLEQSPVDVAQHMKPQASFLLEPDDVTFTPLLAYLGRVEQLAEGWSAIVTEVFGARAGAEVRAALMSDSMHARDRTSDDYGNVDPRFNLNVTSAHARFEIERAYNVDRLCLGV